MTVGSSAGIQATSTPQRKIRPKKLILKMALGSLIWGVIFMFVFNSNGCSSTEGSFHATGAPLGDYVFTPAQCRSGEHESFFGVFLLGESESAGGLKIIVEPTGEKMVQAEVPGSCKGANNDDCRVVNIERDSCETFDIGLQRTDTYVNEIRLLDGHLRLDCRFEDGGSAKADVKFESCD
jgi:hypothetical protein